MSNLENLRKQAKQILRWHRDRYYPVAAQIRETLPRFKHLSDSAILETPFKLADAQELVAKQHGFESWDALKMGHVKSNADRQPAAAPVITAAEPQLFVADVTASCEFFCQKLGFTVAFVYGDPPFYGQVVRGGARLNLRCVDNPVMEAARRDREELLSAALTVETAGHLKQLFLDFKSAGAQFHQTLKKQPWGARNFIVKDPDGNLLLFASPGE